MSNVPKIHPFEFLYDFIARINDVCFRGKFIECPYCGTELNDELKCNEHGSIETMDYLEEIRQWNKKASNAIEMIMKEFGRDVKKISIKDILRMFEDFEESKQGV